VNQAILAWSKTTKLILLDSLLQEIDSKMNSFFLVLLCYVVRTNTFSFMPTKELIEAAIAKVEDLEETELAAKPRNFQESVARSIDLVRDLEETEFAAKPLDHEADVNAAIDAVRDLEETDFAAQELDHEADVAAAIALVRDLQETELAARELDAEFFETTIEESIDEVRKPK